MEDQSEFGSGLRTSRDPHIALQQSLKVDIWGPQQHNLRTASGQNLGKGVQTGQAHQHRRRLQCQVAVSRPVDFHVQSLSPKLLSRPVEVQAKRSAQNLFVPG